jgi:hypothetical protein
MHLVQSKKWLISRLVLFSCCFKSLYDSIYVVNMNLLTLSLENSKTFFLNDEKSTRTNDNFFWEKFDKTTCGNSAQHYRNNFHLPAEPEFWNLLRSPGIDSHPGESVRPSYLTYRSARLHCLAESIPWNQFLGSLNVYKFGLCFCRQLYTKTVAFKIKLPEVFF